MKKLIIITFMALLLMSSVIAVRMWEPYLDLKAGEVVEYENHMYEVIQSHHSLPGWSPNVVPALFRKINPDDFSGRTLLVGEIIDYKGQAYVVRQTHTTQSDWTPDKVPALFAVASDRMIVPIDITNHKDVERVTVGNILGHFEEKNNIIVIFSTYDSENGYITTNTMNIFYQDVIETSDLLEISHQEAVDMILSRLVEVRYNRVKEDYITIDEVII